MQSPEGAGDQPSQLLVVKPNGFGYVKVGDGAEAAPETEIVGPWLVNSTERKHKQSSVKTQLAPPV